MYLFCRRNFRTLDHIMVWRPTVFPIICSPPRCRFPIRDPNLVTTEPTDDMARDGARPFAGTMVPPIKLEISSNFCGQQKWFCIVLLIWWRHSNLPIRLKNLTAHLMLLLTMYLAQNNSLDCVTSRPPAHWSTNETHELPSSCAWYYASLTRFWWCFAFTQANANEFRAG